MGLAVAKRAAYSYYKHRTFLARDDVFALLWCLVGIQAAQFFGMNKINLIRQYGLQLRICLINHELRAFQRRIYAFYDTFQEIDIAVLGSYYALPVPLVYI